MSVSWARRMCIRDSPRPSPLPLSSCKSFSRPRDGDVPVHRCGAIETLTKSRRKGPAVRAPDPKRCNMFSTVSSTI
eukprot:5539019-Prymnesium_polylepis.1